MATGWGHGGGTHSTLLSQAIAATSAGPAGHLLSIRRARLLADASPAIFFKDFLYRAILYSQSTSSHGRSRGSAAAAGQIRLAHYSRPIALLVDPAGCHVARARAKQPPRNVHNRTCIIVYTKRDLPISLLTSSTRGLDRFHASKLPLDLHFPNCSTYRLWRLNSDWN